MEYDFVTICDILKLGNLIKEPMQIFGGKTNKMYKISTVNGNYAIKIMSKSNIEKNSQLLDRIEMTERIANEAKKNNISVISSLMFNNTYVQQINGEYILVYNWYDGDMLYNYKITSKHVLNIAMELAKFHKIKIFEQSKEFYNSYIDLEKYTFMLNKINEEWAIYILSKYETFKKIYDKCYKSYKKISNQRSFIHADLSSKNILLVNKDIYFLDWETAKIGNPSIDFFYTSWFGIGDFDEKKYYEFSKTYFSYNNLIDDMSISAYAALTEEFAWFELCLKRALSIQTKDVYEINIGKDSAVRSLDRILKCYKNIPKMLEIIEIAKNKK